jgi:hypothetical protein
MATQTPLAKGEGFVAVLPRQWAHIARSVLCTVFHSTTVSGGGVFHAGAKFERLLMPGDDSRTRARSGESPPGEPAHPPRPWTCSRSR